MRNRADCLEAGMQRYDHHIEQDQDGWNARVVSEEDPKGDWVRWEEHETSRALAEHTIDSLRAELEAYREDNKRLRESIAQVKPEYDHYTREYRVVYRVSESVLRGLERVVLVDVLRDEHGIAVAELLKSASGGGRV